MSRSKVQPVPLFPAKTDVSSGNDLRAVKGGIPQRRIHPRRMKRPRHIVLLPGQTGHDATLEGKRQARLRQPQQRQPRHPHRLRPCVFHSKIKPEQPGGTTVKTAGEPQLPHRHFRNFCTPADTRDLKHRHKQYILSKPSARRRRRPTRRPGSD